MGPPNAAAGQDNPQSGVYVKDLSAFVVKSTAEMHQVAGCRSLVPWTVGLMARNPQIQWGLLFGGRVQCRHEAP